MRSANEWVEILASLEAEQNQEQNLYCLVLCSRFLLDGTTAEFDVLTYHDSEEPVLAGGGAVLYRYIVEYVIPDIGAGGASFNGEHFKIEEWPRVEASVHIDKADRKAHATEYPDGLSRAFPILVPVDEDFLNASCRTSIDYAHFLMLDNVEVEAIMQTRWSSVVEHMTTSSFDSVLNLINLRRYDVKRGSVIDSKPLEMPPSTNSTLSATEIRYTGVSVRPTEVPLGEQLRHALGKD